MEHLLSRPDTGQSPREQKVFVVDDDAAMRRSLQSMLLSVGYEVELFESGTDLLARAEEGLFGCIVLDVRLPGPSGLEVQRRLAESGVLAPIIFVTGHGDIAMAVQAMKARATEFLTKPFREQELLDAISRALEIELQREEHAHQQEHIQQQIQSLSPREREIFDLLRQGQIGKQIAHSLGLSEATVKVHRRNIMQKLQVTNSSQLVLLFGSLDAPRQPTGTS